MTSISLSSSPSADLKVDALVLGVVPGARGLALLPGAETLDEAFGRGLLVKALTSLGATGKDGEVTRLASLGWTTPTTVLAVGLGTSRSGDGTLTGEALRRAAGCAVRALAGSKKVATTLAWANGTPGPLELRAVCEGVLLGAYSFTRYRHASAPDHREPVPAVTLLVPDTRDADAKQAVRRADAVVRGVTLARDLVNTPAADLHPAELADAARRLADEYDLAIEVLDEKALKKGKYGGILGVGAGSAHPPRLVRLACSHPDAVATIHLVGKGITFDSGGLSLKPAQAMEWMKADMGGAAAVLGALAAVASLGPAVNVVGWLPTAENMPSGTAIRPSDVLTMYGGKRVEVMNTDAEGRLVLADALARASEERPDLILDAATLTGAQLVALGSRTAAVMANDDDLRAAVCDAAGRAGEAVWPMPLPPELRAGLDSAVADMTNVGPREGGMLTAGLFLKEFVGEGIPWAHLDIAGPAYNQQEPWGYTPKGGTGAAVRTFVQVVEDVANGLVAAVGSGSRSAV